MRLIIFLLLLFLGSVFAAVPSVTFSKAPESICLLNRISYLNSLIVDQANACVDDLASASTVSGANLRRLLSSQPSPSSLPWNATDNVNHKGEQLNKHNQTQFHVAAFCPGCPFGADNGPDNADSQQNKVMSDIIKSEKMIVSAIYDVVEIIERLTSVVIAQGNALSATLDTLIRFIGFKGSSLHYLYDRIHLQAMLSALSTPLFRNAGITKFLSNIPRVLEVARYINQSEIISSESIKFYVLSKEAVDGSASYGACQNKSIAYVPSTQWSVYSLTLVRKCYRIGVDAAILMNSTIPPPACFDEITGWKYRQDAEYKNTNTSDTQADWGILESRYDFDADTSEFIQSKDKPEVVLLDFSIGCANYYYDKATIGGTGDPSSQGINAKNSARYRWNMTTQPLADDLGLHPYASCLLIQTIHEELNATSTTLSANPQNIVVSRRPMKRLSLKDAGVSFTRFADVKTVANKIVFLCNMGYGSETASTEYTNVFKASTADFSDFCVKTTSNAISTTYVKYLTGRSGAPGAASCYYKTDANDDRRWLTVNQKSRDYLRRSESCGPAKSDYRYMQSKRPDLTVINEEGGDTCDVAPFPTAFFKSKAYSTDPHVPDYDGHDPTLSYLCWDSAPPIANEVACRGDDGHPCSVGYIDQVPDKGTYTSYGIVRRPFEADGVTFSKEKAGWRYGLRIAILEPDRIFSTRFRGARSTWAGSNDARLPYMYPRGDVSAALIETCNVVDTGAFIGYDTLKCGLKYTGVNVPLYQDGSALYTDSYSWIDVGDIFVPDAVGNNVRAYSMSNVDYQCSFDAVKNNVNCSGDLSNMIGVTSLKQIPVLYNKATSSFPLVFPIVKAIIPETAKLICNILCTELSCSNDPVMELTAEYSTNVTLQCTVCPVKDLIILSNEYGMVCNVFTTEIIRSVVRSVLNGGISGQELQEELTKQKKYVDDSVKVANDEISNDLLRAKSDLLRIDAGLTQIEDDLSKIKTDQNGLLKALKDSFGGGLVGDALFDAFKEVVKVAKGLTTGLVGNLDKLALLFTMIPYIFIGGLGLWVYSKTKKRRGDEYEQVPSMMPSMAMNPAAGFANIATMNRAHRRDEERGGNVSSGNETYSSGEEETIEVPRRSVVRR